MTTMSVEAPPLRLVTEPARERETLSYAEFIVSGYQVHTGGKPLPPTDLRTSPDAALTAFAQLAVCRTNTSRSLISVFDQNYQYVVAEATSAMPLSPSLSHEGRTDDLWLCGAAIPRAHGACEYVVCGNSGDGFDHLGASDDPRYLPLTKIADLADVPRFASKPYCQPGSSAKFFAAVPIRTNKGINIGTICVMHPETVDWWDSSHTQVLRDLSRIIMDHLEARRNRMAYHRAENMKKGLSLVLEEKGNMSRSSWDDDASTDPPASFLTVSPLTVPVAGDSPGLPAIPSSPRLHRKEPPLPWHTTTETPRLSEDAGKRQNIVDNLFSKAASVVRESFDVDGCLFADPTLAAFGSLASPNPDELSEGLNSSSTSSSEMDEGAPARGKEDLKSYCRVLGLSTEHDDTSIRGKVPHALIIHLLRRYPNGRIFNFDCNGELVSSDDSDCSPSRGPKGDFPISPTRAQGEGWRKPRKAWTLDQQSRAILELFPAARSVAFMPIRDVKKDKWFAAQIIYTKSPSRHLSEKMELNLLKIFGILVMDNVRQHEVMRADKAKSDALSCISHEMRSPLHGILLGLELLKETDLGVLQMDIAHTMEVCCRTLTDTTDHLLDFAGINLTLSKKHRDPLRRRGFGRTATAPAVDDGMTSLQSIVDMQGLVEEVVESVFAGFHYQYFSVKQLAQRRKSSYKDDAANSSLDGLRAAEDLDNMSSFSGKMKASDGEVDVFFMVDLTCSWSFYTEAGAIRRIIMNLFGNSLKYTQRGSIKVILSQRDSGASPGKRMRQVAITITDTGSGMTQDYLQNHLFRPFTQENSLSPGTGLGLSLVKRIVSHLRGRISVESSEGVGTRITVTLPLMRNDAATSSLPPSTDENDSFPNIARQLAGLRVRILGFGQRHCHADGEDAEERDGLAIIRMICTKWLRLHVIAKQDESKLLPDLVLMSADVLPMYKNDKSVSRSPTVVVCGNALLAFKQSAQHQSAKQRDGLLEFISQPIGPRKLGNILRVVFDRWKDIQEYSVGDSGIGDEDALQSPWGDAESIPTSPVADETTSKAASRFPTSPEPQERNSFFPTLTVPARPKFGRGTSSFSCQTRFLLVDDNHINLTMLKTYMTKLKRQYGTANNGEEAVNAYKEAPGHFQCILMDISMPVMDGLQATRLIRQYEQAHKLQPSTILALTGLASEETQQEAFASGIDLFLTKPVKFKELGVILSSRGIID